MQTGPGSAALAQTTSRCWSRPASGSQLPAMLRRPSLAARKPGQRAGQRRLAALQRQSAAARQLPAHGSQTAALAVPGAGPAARLAPADTRAAMLAWLHCQTASWALQMALAGRRLARPPLLLATWPMLWTSPAVLASEPMCSAAAQAQERQTPTQAAATRAGRGPAGVPTRPAQGHSLASPATQLRLLATLPFPRQAAADSRGWRWRQPRPRLGPGLSLAQLSR